MQIDIDHLGYVHLAQLVLAFVLLVLLSVIDELLDVSYVDGAGPERLPASPDRVDTPCLHSAESGNGAAPAPRPSAAIASSQALIKLLVLVQHPLRGSIEFGGLMGQQIPYGRSGQLRL